MPEAEAPQSRRTRHKNDSNQRSRTPSLESAAAEHTVDPLVAQESQLGSDFSPDTFERHAALLDDPRLSNSMYARQRAMLVQQLQRDYGNQYVQRLVSHVSQRKAQTVQTNLADGLLGHRDGPESTRHFSEGPIQRKLYSEGDPGAANVPQKAKDVAAAIVNGSTATAASTKVGKVTKVTVKIGGDEFIGGDPYGNRSGDLPASGAPYKEYDVNPYTPGVNRGTERVVIGSDGKKYYTNNHYTDFTEIS